MNKDKKYWFYIEPYVYISLKDETVLLLNTLDNNILTSIDEEVITLIKSIFEPQNCGVTLLDSQHITSDKITHFIENLQKKYMGDIIEFETIEQKPIQLLPYINIQKDIKPSETGVNFTGDSLLSYLTELTIYINTECKQNCSYCCSYNLQFNHCCKSNNKNIELNIQLIKNILSMIKVSPICQINILGGDITLYKDLKSLIEILQPYKNHLSFNMHYKNIQNIQNTALEFYKNKKQLLINIDFPIDNEEINRCFKIAGKQCTYSFIIKDTKEYFKAQSIIEKYELDSYQIIPFYKNTNIDFFKKNVFLNEFDIIETATYEQIMRNKKVNSIFFGNLLIESDGNVKSCKNEVTLGNIKKQSILELLNIEVNRSDSMWLKIRDEEPCCNCVYQFLCPPPSNYEIVLNKKNLCNIIQQ